MFEATVEETALRPDNDPAAATIEENFVLPVESASLAPSFLVMQQTHVSLSGSFDTKQVEQVHFDALTTESVWSLAAPALAVAQQTQADFDSSFGTRQVEHVHLGSDTDGGGADNSELLNKVSFWYLSNLS